MSEMSDKRAFPRIRSLLGARIEFNHRNSTMNCVIREISAGGAKLEFCDAKSIPDSFDLVIPSKEQRYLAKVCWRHGNNIGVEFQPRAGAPGPQSERDNSLLKLEYENALLRRQIAALEPLHGSRHAGPNVTAEPPRSREPARENADAAE